MQKEGLLPKIRRELALLLSGYVDDPLLDPSRDDFIVYPGLGQKAGIVGALELARRAVH